MRPEVIYHVYYEPAFVEQACIVEYQVADVSTDGKVYVECDDDWYDTKDPAMRLFWNRADAEKELERLLSK